eukprot:COSAG02_NODE_10550_length_1916_cov_1.211888_1_plen_110_part_00
MLDLTLAYTLLNLHRRNVAKQAEFERQLAAGEKAQMMQKLDMLLTTRGEPMDTIKLVRTQTELEVEVSKLKETVQRTEEQLAPAKNEVRETILRQAVCPLLSSAGENAT